MPGVAAQGGLDDRLRGARGLTGFIRSSEKEHKGDALALGADEGRGKLRKAVVSRKQAL